MKCFACRKEIPPNSKFCRYCGVTVEISKSDNEFSQQEEKKTNEGGAINKTFQNEDIDTGFKSILVNLFNLSGKKNFVESLILLIFIAIAIFPLYLYLPNEPEELIYIFNFGVTTVVVLTVFYLKGFKWTSLLWAALAGIITLIFAYLAGLVMLLYAFMSTNKRKKSNLDDLEKDYLYSLLKNGLVWYGLGSVATYGGYLYALIYEGESFYIWYGAVLVGLWSIGKALYYYTHPKQLAIAVENLQSRQALSELNKDEIRKKTRTNFKKFMLYGFLIFVGVIIILAMFSY